MIGALLIGSTLVGGTTTPPAAPPGIDGRIGAALIGSSLIGGGSYTPPTGGPTVISVSVTPVTVTLRPSLLRQLTATVNVTGGAAQTVTWTTTNAAVATVDAAGLVTAVAPGVATITTTSTVDATKFDTTPVTVSAGLSPSLMAALLRDDD